MAGPCTSYKHPMVMVDIQAEKKDLHAPKTATLIGWSKCKKMSLRLWIIVYDSYCMILDIQKANILLDKANGPDSSLFSFPFFFGVFLPPLPFRLFGFFFFHPFSWRFFLGCCSRLTFLGTRAFGFFFHCNFFLWRRFSRFLCWFFIFPIWS